MKKLSLEQIEQIEDITTEGLINLGPAFLEKDAIVAQVVPAICAIGDKIDTKIIFCGGTSLSQAWGLLQRMSEDADFRIVLPKDLTGNPRKKFLSGLKTRLLDAMAELDLELVGEIIGRNGNEYICGEFAYEHAFEATTSMRPHIKIEITTFAPGFEVCEKPLRTIIERVLDLEEDQGHTVHTVGLTDTLADKVVSYLRRTAANRAGCEPNYDVRQIRHLYDVHEISRSGIDPAAAKARFHEIIEVDRSTYGSRFPAFRDAPIKVLQAELENVGKDEARALYDQFVSEMVYAERPPNYAEVSKTFHKCVEAWLL